MFPNLSFESRFLMHRLHYLVFLVLIALILAGCTGVKTVESVNQSSRVSVIVLHFTSENFDTSLRLLTEHSSRPVSAHYLVPEPHDNSYKDPKLRIYQLVDESRRAWHAGLSGWGGKIAINDQSIGVEIVNDSTCEVNDLPDDVAPPPLSEVCVFLDYPDEQISLLMELLDDILRRHPDIQPTNIVGHSDVAPGRKVDPGPLFPWAHLAEHGFGAWYEETTVVEYSKRFRVEPLPLINVQMALAAYGYPIEATGDYDSQTRDVLQSFQLHFRPGEINRIPDVETTAILFALVEKYFPEQLEALLLIQETGATG